MQTVKYEFTREENYDQIFNGNRASTDAMGVIVNWADPDKGRSREVHADEDSLVIASLTFDDGDTDAEPDLVSRCKKVHIMCIEKSRSLGIL